jgi:flagellar protein FlbT
MQMYLTGETEGPLYDQAVTAIAAAMGETQSEEHKQRLIDISSACAAGETYQALTRCRKLLKATETRNG